MKAEPSNTSFADRYLPELPYDSWAGTCQTLQLWTQVVGKIRMKLCPLVNHWWNVPLYVTARGLTTSPMPYGDGSFEISFDFIDHQLLVETCGGDRRALPLKPQTVADFYAALMATLAELGITVKIWTVPCELTDLTRFEQDTHHQSYDPEAAHNFWRILCWVENLFKEFRAGFIGKVSPVHFFWGSFDLAVTRFSGRRAPERPGVDPVTREAYSHEVSSAGFWAGGNGIKGPVYLYAAPAPEGFAVQKVRPAAAYYDPQLSEFLLLYDDVRSAPDPKAALLEFLQSTYDAAANLGKWDRKNLER